jgi:hypothetical protein
MRACSLTAPVRQLAALLRDGSADDAVGAIDDGLLDAAAAHGVAPLLHWTLRDTGRLGQLAPSPRGRLGLMAREAALYDEMQQGDLQQLLGLLLAEGVHPILFKGAALASSHYAATWLRPRGDSDLLLTETTARTADAVLRARGFERLPRPEGPHVTQARYQALVGGVQLAYDVHWRLSEPHVFADCFSFDELMAAAVETPPGRRLCDVHALLVACMHRVAHHHDTDQLILLCDVDRLARGLAVSEWRDMVALAIDRQLAAVCLRGLSLAREAFATPVPSWVTEAFAERAADEPGARFLNGGLRRIDVLASDLVASGSWRARIGLVRRHLFPSQAYMRATHGEAGTLAGLYARRIARGAVRWTQPIGKVRS